MLLIKKLFLISFFVSFSPCLHSMDTNVSIFISKYQLSGDVLDMSMCEKLEELKERDKILHFKENNFGCNIHNIVLVDRIKPIFNEAHAELKNKIRCFYLQDYTSYEKNKTEFYKKLTEGFQGPKHVCGALECFLNYKENHLNRLNMILMEINACALESLSNIE